MSTPLHCAAWKGHAGVVGQLLAAGANPLAITESGWTPLHSAAFRGHAPVAELLLDAGELPSAPLTAADDDARWRVALQRAGGAMRRALDTARASHSPSARPRTLPFAPPQIAAAKAVARPRRQAAAQHQAHGPPFPISPLPTRMGARAQTLVRAREHTHTHSLTHARARTHTHTTPP